MRTYTNKLIELAEEGVISWETIAREALAYMAEADVAEMATCAGMVDDEGDDDGGDDEGDDGGDDRSKTAVARWETVATHTAQWSCGEGQTDVGVQVGEDRGAWFIRTTDDDGGSDEAHDTRYPSRDDAIHAAEELALALDDDGDEGEDEGEGDEARQ